MPKFLPYNTNQNLMIPVNLSEQLVPGTFEYTLNYLVDHEMDVSIFYDHYRNDDNGRPAYDPAMLLKVVLFAYSRGITSSRQIARACRGECGIHGPVRRQPAPFHHHRRFHQPNAQAGWFAVPANTNDLRPA